jgi:hypothetical protein
MEPNRKNLIVKFLNVHYGNLVKENHNGRYERYFKKGSKKSLILHETKEEFIIVNTEMMVNPILNMFNTDYNETYEIIKEWICEKYDINCIEIIGGTS